MICIIKSFTVTELISSVYEDILIVLELLTPDAINKASLPLFNFELAILCIAFAILLGLLSVGVCPADTQALYSVSTPSWKDCFIESCSSF